MGEGEGRNTWRTGRYSPCPREQAAAYLTLLAGLGYQPSVIEQAVARQQPYTGEIPPGQAIIGQDSDPAQDTDGTGSGTAEGGQPDVGQGVSGDEAGAAGPADDGAAGAPIAA
jgi:ParB family chromosome partitioning protein